MRTVHLLDMHTVLIATTIMDDPSFLEALTIPLLRRGMIAGSLCGLCCACLSPLVVLRRMAFIGDGIAHSAFGGIGLALFLISGSHFEDNSVRFASLLYCLVLGVAIGKVSRRGSDEKLAEDSAIGIAFSVSMALGALCIALRQRSEQQYVQPIDAYLFGSMCYIADSDLLILAGLSLTVLLAFFFFYKEIFFYAFDSKIAEISGLPVGFIHYMFILLLVLTVAVSSRVVGIVLVSASLILPGVIALRLCSRLFPAIVTSALIGLSSFMLGMWFSYLWDVNTGSSIVLIQFIFLLAVNLLRWANTLRLALFSKS